MGLDELGPFDPDKKIIEYKLRDNGLGKLVKMDLRKFANETASESTAPGGGSISAYCGALGVSLGTMVANLSAGKRGWEDQTIYFSEYADKGQKLKDQLLLAVDEDTSAFNKIMEAFALPKNTDDEKTIRTEAIQNATKYAVEVPLKVMKLSYNSLELIKAMVEKGNPNSITDAGVGALCIRTAVEGAYLNVRINASGIKDQKFVDIHLQEAAKIATATEADVKSIIMNVEELMTK